MRTLISIGISAAAIIVATSSAAAFGANTATAAPGSNGGTRVALQATQRHCDFSRTNFAPKVPHVSEAVGSVVIRTAGSSVVAEVNLVNTAEPGMHYDVGLIQAPRPSSATCGPGAPRTTYTGLDLDEAGRGTVTIQDGIRQGTTGVWVIIQRPNEHSQDPAEVYTSEFVVPV